MEEYVSGQSNKPLPKPAHALDGNAVVEGLDGNARDGLTKEDAQSRLNEFGRNELDEGPSVQPFKILLRQVANAMMLVSEVSADRVSPADLYKRCLSWPW
jgi:magnesium-transporting ATPase (P-type)